MSRTDSRLTFLVGLAAACLAWQLPAQSPTFEVAAIKLNQDLPIMSIGPGLRNGTLHGAKVTLRRMLMAAYGVTEPRVIGPDWLDKNHFDIAAKSPPGVPDSELKPMMQALLKDRFKLSVHRETREMPIYNLVIASGGVKMSVYPAQERPMEDPSGHGFPMMRGTATTSQLADQMASVIGRPVFDKTGLSDRYNYFLSFVPLSPQTGDSAPEFAPPDFFAAVQRQLGLKLESGKGNVEVIVVDHIEPMPTEN